LGSCTSISDQALPVSCASHRKRTCARAALHSELFDRMRSRAAQKRWVAVRKLIDAHAPRRPEREREIAAANNRYFLSATTWNYYRLYFGFSPDKAIECAQTALRQAVDALGPPRKARGLGATPGSA